MGKTMGPNEKKLVTKRMVMIMIPDGGSALDGFNALTGPNLGDIVRESAAWVSNALEVVKMAPDNPYTTNEEIAAAILEKMQ